jgi:probable rRNA maturation factor
MTDDPPSFPGATADAKKRSGRRAGRSPRRVRVDVDVVTSRTARAPGLARWLQQVAPARARGQITVALTSDARVRALNRQYRHKNAATDVLSFPAGEKGQLGDVVIAAGVAKRQARAAGHSLQTELRVLALHGLLHLLGYDHEQDDGQMHRLEQRLRRKGGLTEGLIERLSNPPAPGRARRSLGERGPARRSPGEDGPARRSLGGGGAS